MEIVAGTTRTHPELGTVRIENVFREYSVFDTESGEGHVPGGWYVQFETDGGESRVEPVKSFTG